MVGTDGGGKEDLRRTVRQRMRALAPLQRALEEELVTARVLASREWAAAGTVAVYQGVAPELSVVGIVNAAWRDGRRTVFPRVEGQELAWREVRSWSGLAPGAYGIPEPGPEAVTLAPTEVDLWVVPGVAFTLDGARLGRGGGFYDRALLARRPDAPVLGVAFEVQMLDALPREAHDVPVDRVITSTQG